MFSAKCILPSRNLLTIFKIYQQNMGTETFIIEHNLGKIYNQQVPIAR